MLREFESFILNRIRLLIILFNFVETRYLSLISEKIKTEFKLRKNKI